MAAAYTREKCPPAVGDVMAECTCRTLRTWVNVKCMLNGATYNTLPSLGKDNGTVREITFRGGKIDYLHDGVFQDLSVSDAYK